MNRFEVRRTTRSAGHQGPGLEPPAPRVRLRLDELERRDQVGNMVSGLFLAAAGTALADPLSAMAAAVGDVALLAAPESPVSPTTMPAASPSDDTGGADEVQVSQRVPAFSHAQEESIDRPGSDAPAVPGWSAVAPLDPADLSLPDPGQPRGGGLVPGAETEGPVPGAMPPAARPGPHGGQAGVAEPTGAGAATPLGTGVEVPGDARWGLALGATPGGREGPATVQDQWEPGSDFPNEAPTATNDTAIAPEQGAAFIDALANDTDPDGDGLEFRDFQWDAAHGLVTEEDNGLLKYTPEEDFFGTETITYVATDGVADAAPATITVNVYPVNDAPVAFNDAWVKRVYYQPGGPPNGMGDGPGYVAGNVLTNDIDYDPNPSMWGPPGTRS
jgi:hypothetical protein